MKLGTGLDEVGHPHPLALASPFTFPRGGWAEGTTEWTDGRSRARFKAAAVSEAKQLQETS